MLEARTYTHSSVGHEDHGTVKLLRRYLEKKIDITFWNTPRKSNTVRESVSSSFYSSLTFGTDINAGESFIDQTRATSCESATLLAR